MSPPFDRSRLRALCLDLDDTILDNQSSYGSTLARTGRRVVSMHPDLAVAEVVATIERVGDAWWSDEERHRRGRLDLTSARLDVLRGALEALGRPDPDFAEELTDDWIRHRWEVLRPHEEAHDVLSRLRAAMPRLALVTNGAAHEQRAKIERFGVSSYFDHVQVEGEFGLGKPDREVYEHVLARLDVAPDEALMVGDNFRCDVIGALDAGMHAAWIDVHGAGAPPLPAPREHLVLRGLRDLLDVLDC